MLAAGDSQPFSARETSLEQVRDRQNIRGSCGLPVAEAGDDWTDFILGLVDALSPSGRPHLGVVGQDPAHNQGAELDALPEVDQIHGTRLRSLKGGP